MTAEGAVFGGIKGFHCKLGAGLEAKRTQLFLRARYMINYLILSYLCEDTTETPTRNWTVAPLTG